jgi:endonuclease/exonuclease/phosphatase family metal-dependent hydrolase
MRIRLVLAVLAAVLLVLVGARPAPAATPALRTLTFNVCGNVCRQGEVAGTAGHIVFRIRKLNASVTMLQELCHAQFIEVRTRLARYGYHALFAAATTGGRCDDDDDRYGKAFGVAIVARGALSAAVVHRLPSPWGIRPEGRVVLGATVRLAGRAVFAVTTHTDHGGPNLSLQLGALRRWLTPIARTRPVLFGGDLNVLPDDPGLDGFYRAFHEANADRKNPLPTFIPAPRKIDYLFGSRRFLTPSGVSRARTAYSDHYIYLGVFR